MIWLDKSVIKHKCTPHKTLKISLPRPDYYGRFRAMPQLHFTLPCQKQPWFWLWRIIRSSSFIKTFQICTILAWQCTCDANVGDNARTNNVKKWNSQNHLLAAKRPQNITMVAITQFFYIIMIYNMFSCKGFCDVKSKLQEHEKKLSHYLFTFCLIKWKKNETAILPGQRWHVSLPSIYSSKLQLLERDVDLLTFFVLLVVMRKTLQGMC